MAKEINTGVWELSYEEYKKEAAEIRKGDPTFVVRPDNGTTYVSAIQSGLKCLLTKHDYDILTADGRWDQGIYRIDRGTDSRRNKVKVVSAKDEVKRVTAIREALNVAMKNSHDYETLNKSLEQIIAKIVNKKL